MRSEQEGEVTKPKTQKPENNNPQKPENQKQTNFGKDSVLRRRKRGGCLLTAGPSSEARRFCRRACVGGDAGGRTFSRGDSPTV
jgi:hypothetical protein